MLLSFYISLACACWGVVYVSLLTHVSGLLGWLPKYYPVFLRKVLTCHSCMAGWAACVTASICGLYAFILPCMVFSMVMAQIIREYGKFQ